VQGILVINYETNIKLNKSSGTYKTLGKEKRLLKVTMPAYVAIIM